MSTGGDAFGYATSRHGRHRRGGSGTWTPVVRGPHGRRHQADDPPYPPARGSLPVDDDAPPMPMPLLSQIIDAGNEPEPGGGHSISGELPVPRGGRPPRVPPPITRRAPEPPAPRGYHDDHPPAPAVPDQTSARQPRAPLPDIDREQPPPPEPPKPRRTKVTLTPTTPKPDPDDDDVRVYMAPPDGLGKFDLGSVPASVTPPRTWRKAAWFATASSGGVVVALLFAGSVLVGKPQNDQAIVGWPGLQGGQPTIDGELPADPTSTPLDTSRSSTMNPSGPADSSRAPADSSGRPGALPGSGRTPGTVPGTTSGSGSSGPADSTTPTTTRRPQKPPSVPAPYTAEPTRYFWPPKNDPKTLAKQSQAFLDKVTQDPSAAHEMTTGDLRQRGTDGLARKYAGVAYFEVKQVDVQQYNGDGVTVCTVKTVHDDGSTTTEKRTLTFGDGAKISDDGGSGK